MAEPLFRWVTISSPCPNFRYIFFIQTLCAKCGRCLDLGLCDLNGASERRSFVGVLDKYDSQYIGHFVIFGASQTFGDVRKTLSAR
jgi:hypothetical protein